MKHHSNGFQTTGRCRAAYASWHGMALCVPRHGMAWGTTGNEHFTYRTVKSCHVVNNVTRWKGGRGPLPHTTTTHSECDAGPVPVLVPTVLLFSVPRGVPDQDNQKPHGIPRHIAPRYAQRETFWQSGNQNRDAQRRPVSFALWTPPPHPVPGAKGAWASVAKGSRNFQGTQPCASFLQPCCKEHRDIWHETRAQPQCSI